MKTLKLSELDLGDAEVLTREQLKKVLGGMGSGPGGGGSGSNDPIYCVATYTDFQGFLFDIEGECAAGSIWSCNDAIQSECDTDAATAGGTCLGVGCEYGTPA